MESTHDRPASENHVNVGGGERFASLLIGGMLTLDGLRRRSARGAIEALIGGALLQRGATGHCRVYDAAGMSTADHAGAPESTPAKRMVLAQHASTINSDPETLYSVWRDFAGLPRFMDHLVSVTVDEEGRSHWVARAPAGRTVEWEAEVTHDEPGRRIAWRSVEGSEVAHAGSVRFVPAPAGRGTEVHVSLEYAPPGGELGARLARFLKQEPQHQIQEDLRHFKQWIESGEVPTTEGQPSGRAESRAIVNR